MLFEYQKLLKKAIKLEKKYGSLEKFALLTTYGANEHKLKVEDSVSLSAVYLELADLERADLIDYKNLFGSDNGECF